jgi:hypothetical protein
MRSEVNELYVKVDEQGEECTASATAATAASDIEPRRDQPWSFLFCPLSGVHFYYGAARRFQERHPR